MSLSIDAIIFLSFLAVNLLFGLWSSKGIRNIKEYALGGRNFSTAAIAATIVATWISGNSVGMASFDSHSMGVFFLLPGLADALSMFIISYFIAPRIGEFLGNLSVAEAMGGMYGTEVRAISAISGIMPAIGNIAIQFVILSTLLSYSLDIPSFWALIASSFIIIIYSTLGGIKAVTFTDMIQFFTFGVVIPMTAFFIWKSVGSGDAIYEVLENNPIFDYKTALDYKGVHFSDSLLLFCFFLLPGLDPAVFQRISIAKNTSQVSRSFCIAGFAIMIMYMMFWLIGLLILADSNNISDVEIIDSFMNPSQLMSYILDQYMGYGFKGLFTIGLVAMMMSTADSYINSSSVLFSHDLCQAFKITLSEKRQLAFARFSAFLIGIIALLLSLYSTNLLDLILSTYSFYMPIVSVPLLLAIFGFRSTSKSVIIGMIAGFIAVMYCKIFSDLDSLMPGIIANLVFFFSAHYLLKQEGGWIKKRNIEPCNNYAKSIKKFNVLQFCKINAPKEENLLVWFGVFCITLVVSNAYSLPVDVHYHYDFFIEPIYIFILVLSTIFITYPFWLEKFKSDLFISLLWSLGLFFSLTSNSLFLVVGKFEFTQVTILMANFIIVALLTKWQIAMTVIILSTIFSTVLYTYCMGQILTFSVIEDLQFKISYSVLIISGILIAFLKPKQEHLEATEKRVTYLESELDTAHGQFNDVQGSMLLLQKQFEEKEGTLKEKEKFLLDQLKIRSEEVSKLSDVKDEFIRNLTHESNTPMTSILSLSDILYTYYDKLDKAEIKQSIKDIVKGGERLQTYINSITDLSKLSSLDYKLKRKEVNLSQLVKERPFLYKKLFSDECEQQSFVFDVQPDISVNCDRYYITQVLDNLISNAVKYGMGNPVRISLRQNEQGKVSFEIRDEGIGIPTGELISIFDKFTVSSKTTSPAEGRGVGLALVHKIITMHGGRIWAESDGKSWSVFRVVL